MLYPVELRAHREPHCRAKIARFPPHRAIRPRAKVGRGRGIRTPDTLLPKQVRYQTALYPAALDPPVRASAPKRGRDTTNAAPLSQLSMDRQASRCWRGCRNDAKTKGAEAPFACCIAAAKNGAPGEIRTPDHQVRSLVLYPTELRAREPLILQQASDKRRPAGVAGEGRAIIRIAGAAVNLCVT